MDHAEPTSLLEGLFDSDVLVASTRIEDHLQSLLPEERPSIEGARARRQFEFATGRWLARPLLARLGSPNFAILRGEDRVPCWPAGIVGSITHSGLLCAVAIAPASTYGLLGIDLEPDLPVKEGIARIVCRGEELDWISSPDIGERNRRCRIVFSVKEAVYKAFYPRTRRVWSFQDVTVEIDLEAGTFRAAVPPEARVEAVSGRLRRRNGWVVAGVAVPA